MHRAEQRPPAERSTHSKPIVTATSVTSNVITVTAQHSLSVGTQVKLQGTAESNVNGALADDCYRSQDRHLITPALRQRSSRQLQQRLQILAMWQIVPAYPIYQAGNPSVSGHRGDHGAGRHRCLDGDQPQGSRIQIESHPSQQRSRLASQPGRANARTALQSACSRRLNRYLTTGSRTSRTASTRSAIGAARTRRSEPSSKTNGNFS